MKIPTGMTELDYLRAREAARKVTARNAAKFVHEDTSHSVEVFAGFGMNPDGTVYLDDEGRKVRMYGNRTRTLCGYYFDAFEGHERYWRRNKEGRAVDCPRCLLKMKEDP